MNMLENPQQYLDATTNRLRRVTRWGHYGDRRVQDEDVCTHENQALHLMMVLCDLERLHGAMEGLDEVALYRCAGTHDDGEGIGGDVRWDIKNHPLVGPLLEAAEREHFTREVIEPLPAEIRPYFLASYAVQDDRTSRTGRFFNAMEVVGYVIRAYDEWVSGGSRSLAIDVFTNSWDALHRYREEFASVRVLTEPMYSEIQRALATPDGIRILQQKRDRRAAFAAGNMDEAMRILDHLSEGVASAVRNKLNGRAALHGGNGSPVDGATAGTPSAP